MSLLLSIVIPTRNREYYCIRAIENILLYSETFELVIHDNSDSDQVEDFIKTLDDKRIVYIHLKGRINSVINMDKAIGLAKGKYVIMIGDDDTILPNIFCVTQWAESKKYLAVTPRKQVKYFWPDALHYGACGTLIIPKSFNGYKLLEGEIQLCKLLKDGIINYSSFCLPKVYHGLISRSVLLEIKRITGHYIGGLSPDIYLAVACSLLCPSYAVIDFPISIAGACPVSSTAESAKGGHRGELSRAPHLFKRDNYVWNNMIPQVYSVETIWAESALKAISDINLLGNYDYSKLFNSGCFLAGLIGNNLNIFPFLLKKIRLSHFNGHYISFLRFLIKKVLVRGGRALLKSKNIKMQNINSIAVAVQVTNPYVNNEVNLELKQ